MRDLTISASFRILLLAKRTRTSEVSNVNDAKSCFLQKAEKNAVRVGTLAPYLTSIFHMGMKYIAGATSILNLPQETSNEVRHVVTRLNTSYQSCMKSLNCNVVVSPKGLSSSN